MLSTAPVAATLPFDGNGVATMDGHEGAWFKDPGGNVIALHERE